MMFTVTILYILSSILIDTHAQQYDYDVIIMGAGSSGISAAKTLYEANITNILIIEAQWFIGGRTVVHHFSDEMLNIGASWISGTCNPLNLSSSSEDCSNYQETNPMLVAARKYNFSFVISDWRDKGVILDFGGNEHNTTTSSNTYKQFYEAYDCAYGIMHNETRLNPKDMSLAAAMSLCGWSKPLSAIEKTVQWVNFEFDYAEHAKWATATSIDECDTYCRYGPTDVFITDPRGYQGIIKALANEFMDVDDIDNEDKIMLNAPITAIEYDENGVTVTLDDENNNTQYSAKYGIVTFSVGVLQSDIVEFVPKLPSWKMDALLAMDFADYVVILVKWPYDFWSDVVTSEFIIFNDDRFGFFTWVYNLDHENLYNGSLIWRFDVSLDLARTVQYQNKSDTIKLLMDLKLSHYFDVIPIPDDIFVGSWNANKYVQGAYTFFPVGFDQNHGKNPMRWPLERLFFAGEPFNDFGYGFVHTAYLSGIRTANQVLSCMGYDLEVTNGLECPSEYIPPSDDRECASTDESVFKDLAWLWIVLAVVIGIILGYVFKKYFNRKHNKGTGTIYGSVDEINVPMVAQTTDQPH